MSDTSNSKTFQFELVSPEKVLISESATMVVVPGEAGDFGVLANHAPLLSSIRPGVVVATLASGETRNIFVANGFADMNDNVCSVLAEDAVNAKDIDKTEVEQQIKTLEGELSQAAEDPEKSATIRAQITVAQEKLAVAA